VSSFWAHPTAVVDEPAAIGGGTKIWHFCHVSAGARIGAECSLGQNVFVGGAAAIGNRCKIQNNVSVYDAVELADDVFVGPSAVFTNVINPRSFIVRKHEYRRTVVGRGATIGANSTIICGVQIGDYALIAAGAVVTRDVRNFALVIGVPARQAGWVCWCGTTLVASPNQPLRCSECAREYRLSPSGDELTPV
jgi:UDP-2-acetamido-3-amino-2,3-dideoxy-glucuronate N-acetyltransferase